MRDFSTIEDIIEYIVKTRQDLRAHKSHCESILGFHWPASNVHELLQQVDAELLERDEAKIHRFEYDYESKTVYLNMGESNLHLLVQMGLRDYIKHHIWKLLAAPKDAGIQDFLDLIGESGTADIEYEDKIYKQPDGAFGPLGTLPSLVCEIS